MDNEEIKNCWAIQHINEVIGLENVTWNTTMLKKFISFIARQTSKKHEKIINEAFDASFIRLDEITNEFSFTKDCETKILRELIHAIYQLKLGYPCGALYNTTLAFEYLCYSKSSPYSIPDMYDEDFLDISDFYVQTREFVQKIKEED